MSIFDFDLRHGRSTLVLSRKFIGFLCSLVFITSAFSLRTAFEYENQDKFHGSATSSIKGHSKSGSLSDVVEDMFNAPMSVFSSDEIIPAGSLIINMGVEPQTIANGLKPYGMIFDLIKNHGITVKWAIDQNKVSDKNAGTDGIDFSYNGTDYRSGAFIIPSAYRSAAVNTTINEWLGKGVIAETTTSDFTAPIFIDLNNVPNWTLDASNGGKVLHGFDAAEIPEMNPGGGLNFYYKDPQDLDCCDYLYIMPHADPEWETHSNLYDWARARSNGPNSCRGWIWSACHAVSALENSFDYITPDVSKQMNFLIESSGPADPNNDPWAENSAVLWGDHGSGDGEYDYDNSYIGDPFMQFMGKTDGALESGSEQLYMPYANTEWRTSSSVAIFDGNSEDVLPGEIAAGKKAAKLAYGPAFGVGSKSDYTQGNGWVMYEASHSIGGDEPVFVSAFRAFFNFSFMAALDRGALIDYVQGPPDTIYSETTISLKASATESQSPYEFEWEMSTGQGTFTNNPANAGEGVEAEVMYSAPETNGVINGFITLTVRDACTIQNVQRITTNVVIAPPPPVAPICSNPTFSTPPNAELITDLSSVITDLNTPSTGFSITSQPSNGTVSLSANGIATYLPSFNSSVQDSYEYMACDDHGLCCTGTITINIECPSDASTSKIFGTAFYDGNKDGMINGDDYEFNGGAIVRLYQDFGTVGTFDGADIELTQFSPDTTNSIGGYSFSLAPSPAKDTIISISVSSEDDDGYQGNPILTDGEDQFSLGGTNENYVGMRFTNITIPPGATITSAYIQFTSDANNKTISGVKIGIHDTDNSGAFISSPGGYLSSIYNNSAITPATGNIIVPSTKKVPYYSMNLSSLVGSIVNKSGWASNNAMTFIIDNTGTTGDNATTYLYEISTTSYRPVLIVDYGLGPVTFNMAAASDDAYHENNGAVSTGNSDFIFKTSDNQTFQGFLFENVSLPPGAVINSAELKLKSANNKTETFSGVEIAIKDVTNSTSISIEDYYLSDQYHNSSIAKATGNIVFPAASNADIDVFSISSLISGINTQPGWVEGNDVMLIMSIANSGNTQDSKFHDFNSVGDTLNPRLEISYTIPAVTPSGDFIVVLDTAALDTGENPTPLVSPVITHSMNLSGTGDSDCYNDFGITIPNILPKANDVTNPAISSCAGESVILPLNGQDPDGTVDLFKVTVLPSAGTLSHGGSAVVQNVAFSSSDQVTFSPDITMKGEFTIRYVAIDDGGEESDTATYTLVISNCPPTTNNGTNNSILSTSSAAALTDLITHNDNDGTVTSIEIDSVPSTSDGFLTLNGSPVVAGQTIPAANISDLMFQPSGAFIGNVTFTYSAIDNDGAQDLTPATYTIPIINTLPQAVNVTHPSCILDTGAVKLITPLLGTDIDGSVIKYVVKSLPSASGGVLKLGASNISNGDTLTASEATMILFDPTSGYSGQVTWTYEAVDNLGGVSASAGTFTINITTAPVAQDITNDLVLYDDDAEPIDSLIASDDGQIEEYYFCEIPDPTLGTVYLLRNGTDTMFLIAEDPMTHAEMKTMWFEPTGAFPQDIHLTYAVLDDCGYIAKADYIIPVKKFEISLAKSIVAGPIIDENSGYYAVTYKYKIKNEGNEDLDSISLTDDFAGQFGSAFKGMTTMPATMTLGGPAGSGGLETGFTGSGANIELLDRNGKLSPGDTLSVTVEILVDPTVTPSALLNQATTQGVPVDENGDKFEDGNGDPYGFVNDLSDSGSDPSGTNDGEILSTNGEKNDPTALLIPIVELTKGSEISVSGNNVANPGDTIYYTFEVFNTGNEQLTSIVITDDHATGIVCDSTTLLPDNSTLCYGYYKVNQTDIDAGEVLNIAVVNATGVLTGSATKDTSDTVNPMDPRGGPGGSDTTSTLVPNFQEMPSIELTKSSALSTGADGIGNAGDTIHYTFNVTNTGNIILDSLVIVDPLVSGISCDSMQLDTTNSSLCTGYYILSQSDIDNGEVLNTAIVFARSPEGTEVKDTSDTQNPGDPRSTAGVSDSTTTLIPELPSIELTKMSSLSVGTDGIATPGDTIYYDFEITNTGNVTLSSVALSDDTATGINCGATALSVGSSTTCTAYYLLTQPDIDAGEVVNTAVATGDSPAGTMVKDTSDTQNPGDPRSTAGVSDPTTTPIPETPVIELTKSSSLSVGTDGIATPGDTIYYDFEITNTGNVTLSSVDLSDVTATGINCGATALSVGASTSCTAYYLLTQTDIDAGEVVNTAEATGTSPAGTEVKDTSDTQNPGDPSETDGDGNTDKDETTTLISEVPSIELTKSSSLSLGTDGIATPGDTIYYDFEITNTGNVTLSSVALSDDTATGISCGATTLSVGASTSCTAYYLLTQTDIDAGEVVNTAVATGTSPAGTMVKDTSDTQNPGDPRSTAGVSDSTTTTIPETPVIELTKSSSLSVGTDGIATPGDTIYYDFEITNTGNVTLSSVALSDDTATGISCGATTLSVGASTSCTAYYLLTQTDIDAGEVVNTAEAAGTSPAGTMAKDTSDTQNPGDPSETDGDGNTDKDETTTLIPEVPSIELTKSSSLSVGTDGIATPGDTIYYDFEITNTGNVTLSSVALSDDTATGISCGATTLSVGASTSCTAYYLLTQTDIDAGEVVNTAEAAGTSPAGTIVKDTSDTQNPGDPRSTAGVSDSTTTLIPELPSIELTKSSSLSVGADGEATPGDTIYYDFEITNTGNVTLSSVALSDDTATGINCGATALSVGSSTSCTAYYLLTQTDIDAGEVVNTAVAAGTAPAGTMVKDTSDTQNPGDPRSTAGVSDSTTTLIPELPSIELTKMSSLSVGTDGIATPGDTIYYDFEITNTGNVTLSSVALSDDTATGINCGATALSVGSSTTCTAYYLLTQPDIDAGEVVNTAVATGDSPAGTMVKDTSDTQNPGDPRSTAGVSDSTTTLIPELPSIELTKSSSLSVGADGEATPGDTIYYDFEITNTGNVTLSSVALSDDTATGISCGATTLSVGASTSCTAYYLLTQTDIDAGEVVNTAEAAGTSPAGTMAKDTSDTQNPGDPSETDGDGNTDKDETTTLIPEVPSIELTKSSSLSVGTDGIATPGDTIYYDFEITNTGNVTLSSVSLSDDTATGISCEATTLSVGASTSCTAYYLLTQTDIDAGEVVNTAVAAGTSPASTMVKDTSDTQNPGDPRSTAGVSDSTTTLIPELPSIELTKMSSLSVGTDGIATPGDTIYYDFEITNTGNVTLSSVALSDDTATGISCGATTLSVGASTSCTAYYLLTQTDIDAGEVVNTAEAAGTSPAGTMAKDTSDTQNPGDPSETDGDGNTDKDETTTLIPEVPSIELTKSSSLSVGTDGIATPGDTIYYDFEITNTGNVTLSSVALSDDTATGISCGATTLSVGASTSCTAYYLLTQTDIDAGEVVNTAEAAGTSPAGTIVKDTSDTQNPGDPRSTAGVSDSTTTLIPELPSIELTKSSSLSVGADGEATPGDTIYYDFEITNTGNVTLSSVALSDDTATGINCGATALSVGSSTSCTAYYLLTQTDIDAGEVVNTAVAAGTAPAGTMVKDTSDTQNPGDPRSTAGVSDSTTTLIPELPSIELTKMSSLSVGTDGIATPGDTIYYDFEITNTGNVTLSSVALSDDTATGINCGATALSVGSSTTCTAYYLLTQPDIDAGEVVNTAVATGDSPAGTMVKDTSDTQNPGDPRSTAGVSDSTTTLIPELPSIELTKSSSLSVGADGEATPGDTIYYDFEITNTGNVTLSSVALSDDKATGISCGATTLSVGASTSCTAYYLLTQTDIDAGEVVNTAEAAGTSPAGTMAKDTSDTQNPGDPSETDGDGNTDKDETTTLIPEVPSIELTKSSSLSVGTDGIATPGDTIYYDFEITNTGNVTLSSVSLSDDTATGISCEATTLSVGASTSCTAYYLLTQTDIDAGEVVNTAVAAGTSPASTMVKDTSDTQNPGDPSETDGDGNTDKDETTTLIPEVPSIELTKSSSLSVGTDGKATPGDTIYYDFEITNTGNVTLSSVALSDDTATGISCGATALSVGSSTTCTAYYLLTQPDIDAGEVVNTAVATGDSPAGTMVKDTSDTQNPGDPRSTAGVSDPTTTPIPETPVIELTKSSSLSVGTDGIATPGDTIYYDFEITNTGNVTLSSVALSDDTASGISCGATTLSVGASTFCTAYYLLTQTDIDAGEVVNTAVAAGTAPAGTMVKDTSDTQNPGDPRSTAGVSDPTTTLIPETPVIELTKSSSLSVGTDGIATPGDTIYYDFEITNTGNVTLSSVALSDDTATGISCGATTLSVGASTSCTAYYLLTQTDIDAGEVVNTAVAAGTSPAGTMVKDTSDTQNPGDPRSTAGVSDPTTTLIPETPVIELTKSSSLSVGTDGIATPGDTIYYDFEMTNTGNVTLSNVALSDDTAVGVLCDSMQLNVGNSSTCTAYYLLTQTDIDAGEVINSAIASGDSPAGTMVKDTSDTTNPGDPSETDGDGNTDKDATTTLIPENPAIELTKNSILSLGQDLEATPGDTIYYSFEITNTGNVTLDNVSLTDLKATGLTCGTDVLAPGASSACTGIYLINQVDIDAGEVLNSAIVTGVSPEGTSVKDTSDTNNPGDPRGGPGDRDTTTTLMAPNPSISLIKSVFSIADNGDGMVGVGDVVNYTFKVKNTGNVTLSDVQVTDPLVAVVGDPIMTLEVGETDTESFTATYTLTQDDVDAGGIENTAEVTGTPPDAPDGAPADPVMDISDAGTDPQRLIVNNPESKETDALNPGDNDSDLTNDPTVVLIDPNPGISIIKSVSGITDNGDGSIGIGDTVNYEFEVRNIGNVTLSNVMVTDPIVTVNGGPLSILEVGNSNFDEFTAKYALTQEDIDRGGVENTALVFGTAPDLPNGTSGMIVTDVSDAGTDPEGDEVFQPEQSETNALNPANNDGDRTNDPTVVLIPHDPGIEVVKSVSGITDNGDGVVGVGDIVNFAFAVTNTGNVTLSNVVVTDPLADVDGNVILELEVNKTNDVEFTASYTLTQDDVDAGGIENTAEVVGTPPNAPDGTPASIVTDVSDAGTDPELMEITEPGLTETDALNPADNDGDFTNDPTVVLIDPNPSISLIKSVFSIADNGDSRVGVGDIVNYVFSVTNTGNVTLTNVIITDPLVTVTGGPIASLAVNATVSNIFTATYTLTQEDVDAGGIENTALVTGTPPVLPDGSVALPVSDVSDAGTDPDRVIVNNPEQTETDALNPNDNDSDQTNDPTVVLLEQNPGISIIKSVTNITDNGDGVIGVGDEVNYSFAVTNTGNVTLSNVNVSDPLVQVEGGPLAMLPVNSTDDVEFSATYILTQDDIDAGGIENTATVSAVPPILRDGTPAAPVSDISDAGTDPDGDTVLNPEGLETDALNPGDNDADKTNDPTVILIAPNPQINLIKSISEIIDNGDNEIGVGDIVNYSFAVSNIGNVTLTNVKVLDPNVDVVGGPIPSLAVNTTDKTTFSASYTLTQEDVDAGGIENTAIAFGTPPNAADGTPSEPVTDTSDSGTNPNGETILDPESIETDALNPSNNDTDKANDPTVLLIPAKPAVSLIKSISNVTDNGDGVRGVGDIVHYIFAVSNIGNVTLSNLEVTDPLVSMAGGPINVLSVGDTDFNAFTATYILTQSDVDAGGLENSATVTGLPPVLPDGSVPEVISDISDAGTDPHQVIVNNSESQETDALNPATNDGDQTNDPTVILIEQNPGISIIKNVSSITDNGDFELGVGDRINYTFYVSNIGNVTLSNVTVTDPIVDVYGGPLANLPVNVTNTNTFKAEYIITQDDVDAGGLENVALASGIPPNAPDGTPMPTVEDMSDAGTDPMGNIVNTPEDVETDALDPGDNDGDRTNDPAVVLFDQQPAIQLIKSVSHIDDNGDDHVGPGDLIHYAFTVSNIGNVTLTNITIHDPKVIVEGAPLASLAPNMSNSTHFTATYELTQADADLGGVENTATVNGLPPNLPNGNPANPVSDISDAGTDPEGNSVPDPESVETNALNPAHNDGVFANDPTVVLIEPILELELIMNIGEIVDNGDGFIGLGDTVVYTFEICNTGNMTMTDIFVSDFFVLITGQVIDTLAPGECDMISFTGEYIIQQSDVDQGELVNSAIVEGSPLDIAYLDLPLIVTDISDDGSNSQSGSMDPIILCVTSFVCPSDLTETSCQTQSEIDMSFANWVAQFEASGCGNSGSFSTPPGNAPASCGGSKTLTWNLVDLSGAIVSTCSATFTVEADVQGPVCPVNWDITVTPNMGICEASPYEDAMDLLNRTGINMIDNCSGPGEISLTYSDYLVPEDCTGNGFFSAREIIRSYQFTDACGNESNICDQVITYEFDECVELDSYGQIGIDGQTSINVNSSCNVPLISVMEEEQGVCGYVDYMWLVSTVEDNNGDPVFPTDQNLGTIWIIIPGANEATYDPGFITQNTYFVRCVRNFSCCDYGESNLVAVRLDASASCPVILPPPTLNEDCNNPISLLSPTDDFMAGERMKYVTDQSINAENRVGNGSLLILDGKNEVIIKEGFEIEKNAELEVYNNGCENN